MNENKENGIVELGNLLKSSVGYAVSNSGKIIAIITLIIAALTTFANITFADLGGEAFTITLVVMLISSYIMYFSLEDAGEKEGAECEEYTAAKKTFLSVKNQISPDDIANLRDFCLDYSENELNYRRRNYLCENGLTISDLEKFNSGTRYSARTRRPLRKARRMKAVNLTVARLLSTSHGATKSELSPPEKSKMAGALFSLIPSTLCTVFTASIILTTKSELTASTVIDGLIKLSALPLIGFKGFLDGYRYAKEVKSAWFETKSRVLEAFILKRGKEIQIAEISK